MLSRCLHDKVPIKHSTQLTLTNGLTLKFLFLVKILMGETFAYCTITTSTQSIVKFCHTTVRSQYIQSQNLRLHYSKTFNQMIRVSLQLAKLEVVGG